MTPLILKMLIHFYVSPAQYDGVEYMSDAYIQGLHFLFNNELIDRTDGCPRATDKGEFWLHKIMKTPFPVQEWTIPKI